MFSDLGILMLLASLDKLINEISKNRNASSKIMSFRLTSCYDFSFVGCKNHLTCIPRACNDQDYVSISVPARFYWLQESGTHKCLFFFFFFFFFWQSNGVVGFLEQMWPSAFDTSKWKRRNEWKTSWASPLTLRLCVWWESCGMQDWMLRSAAQKIIPIFYKSSLSLSDPEEIIVKVRILRKKRKKKDREVRRGIWTERKGEVKTFVKKKLKNKLKAMFVLFRSV